MNPNQLGAYGPWAASLHASGTGRLSLRSGKFRNVNAWRRQARARALECLAPPPKPRTPKPKVEERGTYDGLYFERLTWQLPWGPRTEAVFLKPASAGPREKLPAVLGLHDHAGRKFWGWKKIAKYKDEHHPLMRQHHDQYYGGKPWANEAARRGYAVLAHDTFPFASRKVNVADVHERIRGGGVDPDASESNEAIEAYNQWAGNHEHQVAKSLFCAGTTWPGVYLAEDQAALSILCARKDVDAKRVACGGLSGGGMRTVYLAGLDDRIRCCACVGFFTTWRDFLLHKAWTHTWMAYTPLLPQDLDFSEILALRAPLPALVQNTTEDPLYTLSEVKRAGKIAAEVYKRAGAAKAFNLSLYPGGHKFDAAMQDEAFAWLEKWMGKPVE